MQKLYKILSALAIFIVVVSTITFSFAIISLGVIVLSLYGIYHYYVAKKKLKKLSKEYSSGEVIYIHRISKLKRILEISEISLQLFYFCRVKIAGALLGASAF